MADNKKKTNPVVSYFKDVKGEMKKVAWPTFKQIKNNTMVVIISVVLVGVLVALLDFGFGKGFEVIVNKDTKTEQAEQPNADGSNIVLDDVELDGDAVQVNPETEADAQAGGEDAE